MALKWQLLNLYNIYGKKYNKKKEEKVIDASGRTLGRVASEVAMSLMGKTSANF